LAAAYINAFVGTIVSDGFLLRAHLFVGELGVLGRCLASGAEVSDVDFLQGPVELLSMTFVHLRTSLANSYLWSVGDPLEHVFDVIGQLAPNFMRGVRIESLILFIFFQRALFSWALNLENFLQ